MAVGYLSVGLPAGTVLVSESVPVKGTLRIATCTVLSVQRKAVKRLESIREFKCLADEKS